MLITKDYDYFVILKGHEYSIKFFRHFYLIIILFQIYLSNFQNQLSHFIRRNSSLLNEKYRMYYHYCFGSTHIPFSHKNIFTIYKWTGNNIKYVCVNLKFLQSSIIRFIIGKVLILWGRINFLILLSMTIKIKLYKM